jgi:alpha-glucoside transport system permease protein
VVKPRKGLAVLGFSLLLLSAAVLTADSPCCAPSAAQISTALPVVWGIGSVVLLYYVLNRGAEMLPRRARRFLLPLVFAGPALALLFWFLVLPTLRTLWLAFFDETSTRFLFLRNFRFAFTDPIMLEGFRNNLLWMVFGTLFCVGLGLVIAV